jgi:hypothetical protein
MCTKLGACDFSVKHVIAAELGIAYVVAMDPKSLSDRRFSSAEVSEAIGVPRSALHTWLFRGHVPVPSLGQGRSRQLNFTTAVELAVIARLTNEQNMTVSAAAAAVNAVRVRLRAALEDRFGLGQVLAIYDDTAGLWPEENVLGYLRDQKVKTCALAWIHNVALDVFENLSSVAGDAEAPRTARRRTRVPA